jgi:hypothetical protein
VVQCGVELAEHGGGEAAPPNLERQLPSLPAGSMIGRPGARVAKKMRRESAAVRYSGV